MSDDNQPRWMHTCARCGVTEPTDRCEEDCPVCQVAMAADKLQPAPSRDDTYPCAGCGRDLGHSPTSHAIEHGGQTLAGCSHECLQRVVSQPSADELARKQRVVDAIGVYMSKPAKPLITRRWRRPGFR